MDDAPNPVAVALVALGTIGAVVVTGTVARAWLGFTESGRWVRDQWNEFCRWGR